MATTEDPREVSDPNEVMRAILDPARRGALYPWYDRLRQIAPVHRTEALLARRAWVLTRFEDIRQVLGNLAMVSDRRSLEIFDTGESGREFHHSMSKQMLYLDPPDHDRVRGLVARHFTPRAIEAQRPRVQREVDRLLDQVVDQGQAELVRDFAYPLPIAVICELMGIPPEDVPRFLDWAHDYARRGDISAVSQEVIARGEAAALGFRDYFLELAQDRRKRSRDDLMTILVEARDAEGGLSDDEIVSTCVILLQAGHETTADLISLGLRGLLEQRQALDCLRAEPHRIERATEELLRWDTSVQVSQRISAVDLQVADATIPAGDVCVILNGAANRDPAKYPHPDRIDLDRSDSEHLTFGLGRYVCLGKSLARLEIQTALQTILRRFPNLDFNGEPRFRPSLYLRGLERLPLKW